MDTNIQNAANVVTEFKEKNERGQSELKRQFLSILQCMIYKADSKRLYQLTLLPKISPYSPYPNYTVLLCFAEPLPIWNVKIVFRLIIIFYFEKLSYESFLCFNFWSISFSHVRLELFWIDLLKSSYHLNAGSIPRSGRSPGEGIGYSSISGLPLWLSW